jgi:hypothetical protein
LESAEVPAIGRMVVPKVMVKEKRDISSRVIPYERILAID